MARIALNIALVDGDPRIDLQVDTGVTPEPLEEDTAEYVPPGIDVVEDSATLADDFVDAVDPEVVDDGVS